MGRGWLDDEWDLPSSSSRGARLWRTALFGVIGLGIVYGLGVWTGVSMRPVQIVAPSSPNAAQMPTQSGGAAGTSLPPAEASGNVISAIYNQVKNSIFTITAVSSGNSSINPQEDVGTGFLIDHNGDIATNAHVVNGQSEVTVTLGQQTFRGHVVGADVLDDLAIVHIDAPPSLQPLSLGSAGTLQPGDLVIAIGNPFELTESVSAGIVSGLNRAMPMASGHVMNGLIQTDAALNPGNSGGPLFNAQGQVVGINTAIESPIEGSVGIGFAIPIDRFKQLEEKLLTGQSIGHPWLGIAGIDVDPGLQQALSLATDQGAYVTYVTPGSPAATAGLHGDSGVTSKNVNSSNLYSDLKGDGDIIVAAAGQSVDSVETLTSILDRYEPGDTVTLTILRNGQRMQIKVTLGNWPNQASS